jgi:cephalosporin-C deacetylase-like acetyl esterase
MYTITQFQSQGATLRGRLYKPNISKPVPIIIMAHGFSATIGMVTDKYAEEFYKAGFAVLLYDHRNFGISDGEPRQELNKWLQMKGYQDAINFILTLEGIDKNKIALWGDSMSAAEVLALGAMDSRIKAIIGQVPACVDKSAPPDEYVKLFSEMVNYFNNGEFAGKPEITSGPLPVVSTDQKGTPSLLKTLTAFRWFIEYGGRHNTNWRNLATYVNPNAITFFHPALCAKHIKAAVYLTIASEDEMASPAVAREVFDLIPGPKEVMEIEGGHFGLLHYPGELFSKASQGQCDFLKKYL